MRLRALDSTLELSLDPGSRVGVFVEVWILCHQGLTIAEEGGWAWRSTLSLSEAEISRVGYHVEEHLRLSMCKTKYK